MPASIELIYEVAAVEATGNYAKLTQYKFAEKLAERFREYMLTGRKSPSRQSCFKTVQSGARKSPSNRGWSNCFFTYLSPFQRSHGMI